MIISVSSSRRRKMTGFISILSFLRKEKKNQILFVPPPTPPHPTPLSLFFCFLDFVLF